MSAPDHPPEPSHQQLALLAGLAVVAVWGANFGVRKALFGLLSPGAFLFAHDLMMPLAGALLLLLAGLPAALAAPWGAMGAWHWFLLLWASLVSAFLGWLVWGWVNEVRGVARTAPLQYLMPLAAGVVAWWATGERFTALKLGGAALTLAGVAWAQYAVAGRRQADAVDSQAQID